MKKDFNQILPPDPEKSWPDAEKMLDQHFQQQRKSKRMGILFVTGLLLLCSAYLLNMYVVLPQKEMTVNSNALPSRPSTGEIKSPAADVIHSGTDKKVNTTSADNSNSTDDQVPIVSSTNPSKSSRSNSSSAIPSKTTETHSSHKIIPGSTPSNAESITSKNGKNVLPETIVSDNLYPDRSVASSAISKISTGNNLTTSVSKIEALPPIHQSGIDVSNAEQVIRTVDNFNLPDEINAKSKFLTGIEFNTSMNYISKTLSASEGSEYLDRRKTEEKSILAPSIGALFVLSRNNFDTRLGVEYSYWGEETAYDAFSKQTQYTNTGQWQAYYRTVIDTDTAYISGLQWLLQSQVSRLDSSYQTYTDSQQVIVPDPTVAERNGTNKFYYFEIPVMVSYHFPLKRFGIGLSVGISPAWLTSSHGYYLKEDLSGVASVSETKPLKTFFVNGRMSLDLSYQINPRLNLVLSPQVKTNLTSISNSSETVQQRYTATGLRLGLVYALQ